MSVYTPIPNPQSPPKTIGILGAGQLGKMLAEAALKLGFTPHLYAPDSDPLIPAGALHTKAEYTDAAALAAFANSVDVITLEFENVPVAPLREVLLSSQRKLGSSNDIKLDTGFRRYDNMIKLLEVTQHRIREKTLARSLGIGTAPFAAVGDAASLARAVESIGAPGILKTCTLGYDGKGQWKIVDSGQLPTLPADGDYIYEGFVDFTQEVSVIVARRSTGEVQCFEPVENVHQNHILHTTTAPANISPSTSAKAMAIATKLANALEVVGLLAVELFVTKEGDVLVNEMAPRPHNSGHWTLDGCNVSQFEQAIRAITGLPLIPPKRTAEKVVMTNLIGDEVHALEAWKKQGAHIHIYGKKETRPGRKMGHVTVVEG